MRTIIIINDFLFTFEYLMSAGGSISLCILGETWGITRLLGLLNITYFYISLSTKSWSSEIKLT